LISRARIEDVKRLLSQGLTQREISSRTGISRGTIGAVANGQRPDYEELGDRDDGQKGSPQRCAKCGVLVFAPCLACRDRQSPREAGRRRTARRPSAPAADDLGLDLHPEHFARYMGLRASRNVIARTAAGKKDPASRAA
jgi:hypothetical protein